MKVIYIDTLFFTNLVIDYLLLLAAGEVCGVILKRRRYALAAVLGSLYAVAAYFPHGAVLRLPLAKLGAGVIMALIAFGAEARWVRCCIVFTAVSAAFGGFLWAIELAGGHPAFDTRTLIVSFALCYVLMTAVFRRRASVADMPRVKVELTLGGRRTEFFALVDSGNSLRDPISALPVMVLCPHAAAPLFGAHAALLELDAVALIERSAEAPELAGRLRLIPYSAVGTRGVLAAFKPDSVLVDGAPREILAAVSPGVAGDGYEGII